MALARGWKVLLVTSVGVYLVTLDVTIVNIAFPAISEGFPDAGRPLLSWVLSGYNIAFAASLMVAGRVADRSGRRKVFFTGIAVFTTGSALCGLAPNAELLIAARVVQAVGGALVLPASLALVLPEFPAERRSAAIGIWGAVGGVAAATGPTVGSMLVEGFGWRAVFFVNAPLCLAAWLVGRRLLVESKDPTAQGSPDAVGGVLGTAGVGLVVLGIVQGGEWGYGDVRTLSAFAASVMLLVGFVWRSAHHPAPVLDLSLFRQRYFAVANTATFLFSVGFFAMLFVNVLFLTNVWGYSVIGAGFALTPGPLVAAAVAGPAGRLADRFGHRVVIVPGAALFALGIAWLAVRAQPEPDFWRVFFPSYVFLGVGIGLAISTLGSASNAFLPPTRFAVGSAFNTTCRQVGAALGIAMAVVLLGEPTPAEAPAAFDRAWWALAAAGASSGLVMLAFYRRPEVAPAAQPVAAGEVAPLPVGPTGPAGPTGVPEAAR
ncbi:N/A [soil metagenome]